ncbi:polyprenyl synthetase family protein, partial [Alistipes sp. OttesenSCG-928-L06]|nr:polyprenyl synthetase family protein [Alistipes sp. OttesenSCG-928-L06]
PSNTLSRDEKIEAVKALYAKTGAKEITENLVNQHFTRANEMIARIPVDEQRKKALLETAQVLVGREK